jgi:hypothetical protein
MPHRRRGGWMILPETGLNRPQMMRYRNALSDMVSKLTSAASLIALS